jgi:Ca-activated chloride channel homolog
MVDFEHPSLLIAGFVVALVLLVVFMGAERRKSVSELAYSNLAPFARAARSRRWVSLLLRAGLLAGMLCSALAVAGVRLPFPVPVHDGAVFVCLDTSGSMVSRDVAPTRGQAVINAARAFIDRTPSGTRIGIIVFSTTASMIQPLSPDRDQVRSALARVPAPNGATAIGDALQTAGQFLGNRGHRMVILITDGVNNNGVSPDAMARELGERHIPVYTIGIGTTHGEIINGFQMTIDEAALQRYAQESGGSYARVENAVQLHDALSHLGRVALIAVHKVNASLGFLFASVMLFCATLFGGVWTGKML